MKVILSKRVNMGLAGVLMALVIITGALYTRYEVGEAYKDGYTHATKVTLKHASYKMLTEAK